MNEEELVSYVVRYCKHELSEEEYRFFTTVVGGKTGKSANFPGMGENL